MSNQPWYASSLHPECPDLRRLADNPGEALLRAEADIIAAEHAARRDEFVSLSNLEEEQQDGRGVTRRTFVAGAAATVTALATVQFAATTASFAATPTGTLIHVFLYGGLPGDTSGQGWLDGLIGTLGPGTAFRGVGVGSTLPRSLVGSNNALALSSVGALNLNGNGRHNEDPARAIGALFTGINHPVEDAVKAGLGALSTAQQLAAAGYTPAAGVEYRGVVSSESGRRVAQNGSGTDHGHGRRGGHPVRARRFGRTDAELQKVFPRRAFKDLNLYV